MTILFKNILVPYDNSPFANRALDVAIALAKLSQAKISLVHVISYYKAVAKIVGPYKTSLIEHVEEFLNEAKKLANKDNVEIEALILHGNVSEEIFKYLNKKKFDLIIVGRRGTSHLTGPSLGSVSNAFVQKSKVPVMVIS